MVEWIPIKSMDGHIEYVKEYHRSAMIRIQVAIEAAPEK
jgi:hypothetical protein